jgi:DNA-binding CsgD family transcriptional regulator
MEKLEKGCVYFFRHIGLTPVKIGYSTHESPISRFEQFKTYAPYGSEIIGFIQSFDAKSLETTLHERFSQYRLSGEWFEISQLECEKVISFYSNIEDIKEKNEFQIAYAKYIDKRKLYKSISNSFNTDDVFNDKNNSVVMPIKLDRKEEILKLLKSEKEIKVSEISKRFSISRKTVYKYINEIYGKKNVTFKKNITV